jgi:predicted ribosome quality control (RQC) complex YloA/Tae2 family protein
MNGPETLPTALLELRRLRKILARALKRSRYTLEKQKTELAETERSEWYRQIADSLCTNPPVPKGCSTVPIFNIHTQKEEPVSLNPKLDFRENAALFYKKARRGQRGKEINLRKTAETEAEINTGERLLGEADAALAFGGDDPKLSILCVAMASALKLPASGGKGPAGAAPGAEARDKIPYRRYTIDNWHIYVGKNDRQNDELTTRFARPYDLWFHAAGHAGSHVVIRRPDRTTAVPQEVVEKVASLAVFFSKAKHTSYAEVHYTEARFVRKRRHSPAGQVMVEKCRSIRVSPRAPEDLFPSKYDDATGTA